MTVTSSSTPVDARRRLRSSTPAIGPSKSGAGYHFFEINKALDFDREKSFGMHLDIPAGTAVRFGPGESKEVVLTEFGGTGELLGLNNLTDGNSRSETNRTEALQRARQRGFKGA